MRRVPLLTYSLTHSLTGFTLVEIMLVVIIIGVLAAMVIPRFAGRTEQAKVARATADLATVALALDLYEFDLGTYPETLDELVAREGNGPYLKRGLPRDPWGRPYEYVRNSAHQQDYDLSSLGPDGQRSDDDIANWL